MLHSWLVPEVSLLVIGCSRMGHRLRLRLAYKLRSNELGRLSIYSASYKVTTTPMQPDNVTPNSIAHVPEICLVDSELGRLAIAVHMAALLRLWIVAREVSKQLHGGSGWLDDDSLWFAVQEIPGYQITRRHYRRLIQKGAGLFWSRHNDRLYLIGIAKVAENLTIEAGLRGLSDVIKSNSPGGLKSAYMPISGNLEQFESHIYAAWIASKRHTTIARDTLAALFNRTANTLRQWESAHLADTMRIIPNYAIVEDPANPSPADRHFSRRVKRQVYQMPNTYISRHRQTMRNGQRGKVKQAVNGLNLGAEADTFRRLYFATRTGARDHHRRHGNETNTYLFSQNDRGKNYWYRTADIYLTH